MSEPPSRPARGRASDSAGNRPGPDPTENVKALSESAGRRLDDLRQVEARHATVMADAVTRHLTEIANLRAAYDEKLRDAESKRIDAIRAVDIGAVQRAAEVSATQAATLAAQVAQSAETLRTQVAAAATASTTALAAALDPIQKDIADLRRAQYEAQGQKINVTEARGSNAAIMAAIGLACTLIIVLIAVLGLVLSR